MTSSQYPSRYQLLIKLLQIVGAGVVADVGAGVGKGGVPHPDASSYEETFEKAINLQTML